MTDTKPTIVVADDHGEILSEISKILESDYDVVAAVANGALAVEAVVQHEPDLVLLDIMMPQMNGIDAARKIRELGLPTRILFLSVHISPEYQEVAQALCASWTLKASLHSELLVAVRQALMA